MSEKARRSVVVTTVLLVSGLVGIVIGGAMLVVPVEFHASAGIALGPGASLLNEMRGSGGALLACGLFAFVGAFRADITFAALLLDTLLFLAYGFSRVFSIVVDGMPDDMLVFVAGLEIAWGLVCASALGAAGAYGRGG